MSEPKETKRNRPRFAAPARQRTGEVGGMQRAHHKLLTEISGSNVQKAGQHHPLTFISQYFLAQGLKPYFSNLWKKSNLQLLLNSGILHGC
jgi:hypothetical protein